MDQLSNGAPTPRYIEQASNVLDAPLLPDHVPVPAHAGSIREIAYRATLRMIAAERHKDRQAALDSPAYNALNWNASWNVDDHIQQVREAHFDDVRLYGDQIHIANDVAAYHLDPNTHSIIGNPRDLFQEAVKLHMWNYVEYPGLSRRRPRDPDPSERVQGAGLAVIAPVGSGKTRLQAHLLKAMGIGKPVGEQPPRNRRALVVVSSQAMVDQYMSEGSDNDFRQVIGSQASYGAVWQFSKESDTDVTFVIDQTLPEALDQGLIKPDDYHVTVVDEGHLSLRGRTLDKLREISSRLLFFTATPALNHARDLRDHFAHVEEGSLRGFVEKGILNEVRLMSFQYNPEQQTELAGELAMKAIKLGRRIVVYCQPRNPDDEEGQTHAIRDYINENLGTDTAHLLDNKAAHVLASANGKVRNQKLIEAFKQGRISSLLTVNMFTEGLNDPALDTVLLIDQNSPSAVNQRAGRVMRTHPGKRESWVMEMIPGVLWRNTSYSSIWQAYGFEFVTQGQKLHASGDHWYSLEDQESLRHQVESWRPGQPIDIEGLSTSDVPSPIHDENAGMPTANKTQDESDKMQLMLQTAQRHNAVVADAPLRTVLFTAAEAEREQFLSQASPVTGLAAEFNMPVYYLQSYFDHLCIPYESMPEGDVYVRHYGQAARKELERINKASRTARRFNEGIVLHFYGMRRECLQEIYPDLGGEQDQKSSRFKYSFEDLMNIEKGFDMFPLTDSNDVSIADVRTRFRAQGRRDSFIDDYISVKEVSIADKRRDTTEGPTPPQPHIKTDDMYAIEEAYNHMPEATSRDPSVGWIAELTAMPRSNVLKVIEPEEYRQCTLMRPGIDPRKYDIYLPEDIVRKVIERLEGEGARVYSQKAKAPSEINPVSQPRLEPIHVSKPPEQFVVQPRHMRNFLLDGLVPPEGEWLRFSEGMNAIKYTHAAGLMLLSCIARMPNSFIRRTESGGLEINAEALDVARRITIPDADNKLVSDYTVRQRIKKRGLYLPPEVKVSSGAKELRRVPMLDRVDICYTGRIADFIVRQARPLPRSN